MPEDWNAAVVYDNLADDGTITCGSQLVDALCGLVQDETVGRQWISPAASSWVLCTFAAPTMIDTAALINIGEDDATGATARCRFSLTDPTGVAGEVYDSVAAVDMRYRQSIHVRPSPVSVRYVRFDLAMALSSERATAGRLVIGARSTYAYNFAYGAESLVVPRSRRSVTRGGQLQIARERKMRTVTLPFSWISEADRYGFVEDIEQNGIDADLLLITNPASTNLARDTVYGTQPAATGVVMAFPDISSKTLTVEERL